MGTDESVILFRVIIPFFLTIVKIDIVALIIENMRDVIIFANKCAIHHDKQFISGVELTLTHDAGETGEMEYSLSGFSHHVIGKNHILASTATGPISSVEREKTEVIFEGKGEISYTQA